jgi:outer membrane receptor for ferrienterochelin and colicins
MYQTGHLFNDVSLYYSTYDDVIKEEAKNAGTRNIWGLEYRGRFILPDLLPENGDISGYINYTYTHVRSSTRYNHRRWSMGGWRNGSGGYRTAQAEHWD